ncbi:primosomal protein DnaI [Streptococcus pantholopis]|uniref:Primosomal protein DnaI n=1 Tax=Streptococcus pantholopis TaxID=1811193 RepID=A0A172Q5L7_9STRE|nr:primosomal protein DnaI [Streptococcus pantholopis]AND78737.1 primosomal protein DnaI [Streptococcus pantholopis]
MEKVAQAIKHSNKAHLSQINTDELKQAILADTKVADFIATHRLSNREIELSLSKFNQFRIEREKFLAGDETYLAKGYEPILVMNEGYADVTYRETKALKLAQAKQAITERVSLVNLPKSYKNLTFDDISLDDKRRQPLFTELAKFVADYPSADQKGLYLYGDMGVGKSFMLAAMAHELSKAKGASTVLLHFPSFAIDVKNAINTGTVKDEIDAVKKAEILILDDIGAEQATSWVRDEVLQVILQYRMLEDLPTFFTSNYSFKDLEKKLANIKGTDETWQAKRVMERIRYLAKEFYLAGDNRRN